MAEFLQSATKVATDVSKVVGQVAGGLHSIGLLDPPVEMLEMPATDRISATVAPNVTLVGQAQVLPTEIGELDHIIRDTATSVVSEVGQLNVQRYVPLPSFEWAASAAAKTEIKSYKMPNDIIKVGPAALLSKFFRYYRTKMEVVVQLNPGPGIAGILVGVYVPGGSVFDVATYKNFPHGIINCSVNTSVTIKIPYFWGSPMWEFDVVSGLGDLKFINLTKLSAPTGAPNTLTVSVFARLVEPEFQALRPLTTANAQGKQDPGGEEVMRVKEGMGAMMLTGQEYTIGPRLALLNEQTVPDDGVVSDTIFTDLREIYTIPSMLAEFEWAQSKKAGEKLLAKNIRCESSSLTTPEYERTNLAHVARFYVLYQGDITLTFQFAASKLNQGRVLAAFFPGETSEFTYDKIANAVTTVMDLGLNSSFDMTLPYVNTTPLRATGSFHGQLMLFVQTPLAYNAAAPSTISGIVYIAGAKNLTFHVPNRRPLKYVKAQGKVPKDLRGWRRKLLLRAGDVESNPGPDVLPSADRGQVADPVGSIENDGGRKPKGEPTFLNMGSSTQGMIPSHTDITAMAGRAMLVDTFTAAAAKKFQSFPIIPDLTSAFELFKIFRFRSGDFNLHITHTSIGTVFVSHGYFSLSSSNDDKLDLSMLMASGAVAVPTGTMITLKVPYYYIQPFTDIAQLGTLYIWPQRSSAFNINVFVSFDSHSRFAFLQSPPEVSALPSGGRSSRSVDPDDDGQVQAQKVETTGMLQRVMMKRRRKLDTVDEADEDVAVEPQGLFPQSYRVRVPDPPPPPPPLPDEETGELRVEAQGQAAMAAPLRSRTPSPTPEPITWQTLWMMADRAEGPYPMKEILLASSPGDRHAVKVRYGNGCVVCTAKTVKEATDMASAAAYEMAQPTMDEFALESTLRMPVKTTWLEMIAEIRATGLWRPRVIAWTVQQSVCVVFEVKENLCHMHGRSKRAVCEQFANDKNRKWQEKGLIDCNDPDVTNMLLIRSGDVEQNPGPLDGLVTWLTGLSTEQRDVAASLLDGITRAPEGLERGKDAALQVFKHQAVSVVVRGLCYYVIFSQSPSTSVTAAAGILALGDAAHYFMEGLGGFINAFSTVMAVDALPEVQQRTRAKKKIGDAIRKCFSQELARDQGPGLKDVAQILTVGKSCEWLLNLLQKILNYLKNTFFPDAVVEAQGKLEEMEVMILDAITETNELADINRQQGGLRTLEHVRRWAAAAHVVNQAIRLAVESKSKAHSFLYQARRSLDSCRLAKGIPETAFRMDPACFHITGPPGQGKTLLLERTAHMVAKSLGSEVYYHPTASAHMDGYYGQRVHVWDEIFARRDETDAELILSLASSGHYIPPMADLGDKGIYYRGEVILSASNNDLKSEMALKCANAIQRRFEQINFRARQEYVTDKNGVACLDEEMANQDGSLKTGECWEVRNGADWETLNLHDMVEKILERHRKKNRVYLDMLGMLDDDVSSMEGKPKVDRKSEDKAVGTDDLPMDSKPVGPDPKKSRYRETINKRWSDLKANPWSEWLKVARDVIATVGTVIGVGSVFYGLYRAARPLEAAPAAEASVSHESVKGQAGARAYSGPVPARRMIRVDRRRDTVTPNGGSSFAHLLRNVVRFQWRSGHEQSAVAMGYGRYLTTAHNMGWGDLEIHSSSSRLDLTEDDFEVYTTTADDGGETDVAELVFMRDIGFDHRDISKYVAKPEEKKSAKIIVAESYGYHEKDIHNLKREPVHIFDGELLKGVIHGQMEYEGSTEPGDCGGMIIQEQKGTWRIVGLHNGRYVKPVRGLYRCTGYELFRLDLDRCYAQGVIVAKQKCDRVHVASRSGLHPSPFSGAFEMVKAPAALSPYDPRLEEKGVSLLKKACEKFDSDVFMVDDPTMNLAMDWMTEDLRSCVPLTGCTNIYEAIRGCGANPLDLTTSPGLKYTKRGKIKRDLFYYDTKGRPIVSADFRDEVIEQYDKLYATGEIATDFCAYLKDELRAVEKVEKGKTRAILACSVDYTVVYRMVMAEMYAHIYNSPSWQTHIAVGIDPFTEASEMVKELVKYQHHYCLDYSSFDGRLPQRLMRMGVEVLSRLHADPDMVTALHEPVVGARCVVMDEMWHLKGGMPSGAPCTSVLNTICNVLAINCVMIGAGYEKGSFGVVAYGDDCVISVREKRELDWVGTMKEWFGMVVTPASKAGEVCAVPLEEVEFLKRKLRFVEGAWRATLDMGTIEQALMWMTSREDFTDKVRSLSLELAQHGHAEFDRVRRLCIGRSDHHFPSYSEAKRMLDSVSVQGLTHLLGIG